jgi:coenzyme F420-reducing hydrogenase delta subunit
MPFSLATFRNWAALAACMAASLAFAAPKTICTITVNSPDEKEVFRRHLPPGDYNFVELVEHGRKDWLASACHQHVQCDALIISGHFDGGDEFYTDRLDVGESLSVEEMERASCSESCPGVFANLKEVYLFGCNTLKPVPDQHVLSNRDRIRQIFRNVPVIYGFSSKAPLGRYAGPVLDKYFQSAPAGEVASGKVSAKLLNLFAPVSMAVTSGVTDADPQAGMRNDACHFQDDRLTASQKVEFMHDLLKRDATEVRTYLEQIEHFMRSISPAERYERRTAAAFDAIGADRAARDRFLAFTRGADELSLQTRLMALARKVGWLTAKEEQAEFVRMIADRIARDRVGRDEVDLACAREADSAGDPALANLKYAKVAQAAALACLGNTDARARVVRALTSPNTDDIEMARAYLRLRPLKNAADVRAVASGIAQMPASGAQVRALETLAQQRVSDPESLREIARLFPLAKSVDVQRAIAGILIRADHRVLGQADLARSLKATRLKSPDGEDVIDALIRVLQAG